MSCDRELVRAQEKVSKCCPEIVYRTRTANNYFNYCKVIMQLQQYFNQLWAVV